MIFRGLSGLCDNVFSSESLRAAESCNGGSCLIVVQVRC